VKQLLVPDDNTYKGYPLRLAERGFVVLVPEHIGFGERAGRSLDDTRANHFFFYHSTLLLGENMLGYLLWDLVRAIDVLQSLPEARKHSIGCYGLSLGGEMTLFLAACDVRIRVACISGFLSSYRSSFLDVGHCGCGYVFQMARFMEHEDIAALIAPRPLLVESGYADSAFRVAEARRVVRNLRFLYRKLGCAENIVHHVHSGGHEIIATEAVNWLDRWLRD
jgi:dienelactone hydrolase